MLGNRGKMFNILNNDIFQIVKSTEFGEEEDEELTLDDLQRWYDEEKSKTSNGAVSHFLND